MSPQCCNIESLVPCKEKRSIPVYTSKKHVSKDIILVPHIRLQQADIKSHSGLEEPSANLHMSFCVLDNHSSSPMPGLPHVPHQQAFFKYPGHHLFYRGRNI